MTTTELATSSALNHLHPHQFKTTQVVYLKLFIQSFQRIIQIFSCKIDNFIQFSHYLLFSTFFFRVNFQSSSFEDLFLLLILLAATISRYNILWVFFIMLSNFFQLFYFIDLITVRYPSLLYYRFINTLIDIHVFFFYF